ncbi:MAG: DUF2318 domain-containing protein [Synergistaceae bacterium]|jgi:uncharacterized membrane protein|nr:DUF2318 domain-containing protein [Synergistaceae bacterium]
MLEYLIKITNNTYYMIVPTVLLLAVICASDHTERKRYVSLGFCVGLISAFIYAVLKRNTGFAVREYYDLGTLIPSLAFGVILLFFMLRVFSGSSGALYRRVLRALVFCVIACGTAYCAPNIMLYPFEFAVGMDTIFNTEFMFRVTGYALGIILTFLTGLALYKTASNISSRAMLAAWAASHITLLAFESLTIAQILLGRNLIRRHRWLTRAVMWALSNANTFIYALVAFSLAVAAILLIKVKTTPLTGENPAQIRKMRSNARRQVRFCASVLIGVVVILLTVTVGVTYSNRRVELAPPVEIPATGDVIVIPLERVDDGNLYRFVHKVTNGSSQTDVRYIVIKKNDTAYGVGLDACDVCGPSGYYQRKDQVVCILCDVVMNRATIGLPGGCNPVPLKFEVTGGNLVIRTEDLAAEARRFQ